MKKTLAIALLLMSASGAQAQIFKCTGPDGRINLTDKPCPSNQAAEAVTLPPPPETTYDKIMRENRERTAALNAETERMQAERQVRQKRFEEEQARRNERFSQRLGQEGLRIGMSFKEVTEHPIWGLPDRINNTTTQNGIRSNLSYRTSASNEYQYIYLYFVNGELTRIRN